MRIWGLSLAAIGIVVAAACGGGGGETTTTGPGTNPGNGNNNNNPNTVTLVDSSFNPANITIKAGQTVRRLRLLCQKTSHHLIRRKSRRDEAPRIIGAPNSVISSSPGV